MEARTLQYIADACDGVVKNAAPDTRVGGISTDSRSVAADELFFALRGERFDAHRFVPEVLDKGALGAVVNRTFQSDRTLIQVDEPRRALGKLAARYRRDFDLPLIAVAGSNGKTSTKELLASVLSRRFNVLWSPASFNNDVGVPLTLLRLTADHQVAVLEVGTNHPGELAGLLDWVRPDIGVLTGIGPEHLEFFRNLEGVAAEEGTLAEKLSESGELILNGDTPFANAICDRCRGNVVKVGWSAGNDWVAERVVAAGCGYRFQVRSPRPELSGEYEIRLLGRPQIINALLAIAVAARLGMDRAQIAAGLLDCVGAPMRLELQRVEGSDLTILNDAYNANAESTRVALETLAEFPAVGRRHAILGEFAELGDEADAAYRKAGQLAATLELDRLWTVGAAGAAAESARSNGLADTRHFDSVEALMSGLRGEPAAGDVILLKGSRRARLERVAGQLMSEHDVD